VGAETARKLVDENFPSNMLMKNWAVQRRQELIYSALSPTLSREGRGSNVKNNAAPRGRGSNVKIKAAPQMRGKTSFRKNGVTVGRVSPVCLQNSLSLAGEGWGEGRGSPEERAGKRG